MDAEPDDADLIDGEDGNKQVELPAAPGAARKRKRGNKTISEPATKYYELPSSLGKTAPVTVLSESENVNAKVRDLVRPSLTINHAYYFTTVTPERQSL